MVMSWLWYLLGICDTALGAVPTLNLTTIAVLLAALLAWAWQGVPRFQAIGASVLLVVGYQFFGNTQIQLRLG